MGDTDALTRSAHRPLPLLTAETMLPMSCLVNNPPCPSTMYDSSLTREPAKVISPVAPSKSRNAFRVVAVLGGTGGAANRGLEGYPDLMTEQESNIITV